MFGEPVSVGWGFQDLEEFGSGSCAQDDDSPLMFDLIRICICTLDSSAHIPVDSSHDFKLLGA